MGLVHSRKLLAFGSVAVAVFDLAGCGEIDDPRASADRLRAPEPAVSGTMPEPAEAVPDSFPPPVENGEPMPPSEMAGGIPPYPGAIVHLRDRRFHSSFRIEAFTFDAWQQVVAFYAESLPGWTMVPSKDVVLFRKDPDQAAITVSPWDYQDLPDTAPGVLRKSRTVIGAAWR